MLEQTKPSKLDDPFQEDVEISEEYGEEFCEEYKGRPEVKLLRRAVIDYLKKQDPPSTKISLTLVDYLGEGMFGYAFHINGNGQQVSNFS